MKIPPLIFVIEDDPILNDIYCVTLNPYFEIQTYLRGDLALEGLKKTVPDVVLLDLNLPKVSGQEILETIRASERFANTKVILTTADNVQADMLAANVDITLLKPVSPNQLRALMMRVMNIPRDGAA